MENTGLIQKEYVNTVIKERPRDIHKGDCGRVLLIAGSKGMAGAAVLCARGALRAGAGLVKVSVPEELYTILQIGAPEATCVSRELSLPDLDICDAMGIGPGLGDGKQIAVLLKMILSSFKKTIVLDADGINAISRFDLLDQIRTTSAKLILTPHIGEAKRLLACCGVKHPEKLDRQEMAGMLAEQTGAVTVLKGAGSLVTTRSGESYINTTGNPGMATGGSGDVLTGILTALAGQGHDPVTCAKAGVFIHGMAGDLCAASLGETGMTAMDLADMTALAFKNIIGK